MGVVFSAFDCDQTIEGKDSQSLTQTGLELEQDELGEQGLDSQQELGEQGLDSQQELGEQGLGEQGLGEQGLGEQGLGEQGLGEQGLGEQGLGEQGLGEKLPEPNDPEFQEILNQIESVETIDQIKSAYKLTDEQIDQLDKLKEQNQYVQETPPLQGGNYRRRYNSKQRRRSKKRISSVRKSNRGRY
jgi:hypothetical protein